MCWAVGNGLATGICGQSTMAGITMAIMDLHVLIMSLVVPMNFGLLRLLAGVVLDSGFLIFLVVVWPGFCCLLGI